MSAEGRGPRWPVGLNGSGRVWGSGARFSTNFSHEPRNDRALNYLYTVFNKTGVIPASLLSWAFEETLQHRPESCNPTPYRYSYGRS
jgi:hypothetical protein